MNPVGIMALKSSIEKHNRY